MELPGVAQHQHHLLSGDDDPNDRSRHYTREDEPYEPPVRNLDRFFTNMYAYYSGKGLPAIVLQQVTAVVSLAFTIGFSVFLVAFVDWGGLKRCKDEASCAGEFVLTHPLAHASWPFAIVIVAYGTLFAAFWTWRLVSAADAIASAVAMERFYRERLGLRVADLTEVAWSDVVERLIRLHEHGIHRVAIKDTLTEHDVVLRIMRKVNLLPHDPPRHSFSLQRTFTQKPLKTTPFPPYHQDNYMIGLINKKLLDLRVPWWLSPFMSDRLFLTRSLEWSLSFCILEFMFTDQFTVSASFLKDVSLLQVRPVWLPPCRYRWFCQSLCIPPPRVVTRHVSASSASSTSSSCRSCCSS
jgi:autophagy-related protein 9